MALVTIATASVFVTLEKPVAPLIPEWLKHPQMILLIALGLNAITNRMAPLLAYLLDIFAGNLLVLVSIVGLALPIDVSNAGFVVGTVITFFQ